MKKTLIIVGIVFSITLVLATMLAISMKEEIIVEIPAIELCLNEQTYSNLDLEIPFIRYKRITYVPLNPNMGKTLGFDVEYLEEKLQISLEASDVTETLMSKEHEQTNFEAVLWNYPMSIDGETFDMNRSVRPVLMFNDTVYVPLVWDFATEGFGWEYSWSNTGVLTIASKKNKQETVALLELANEPTPLGEQKTDDIQLPAKINNEIDAKYTNAEVESVGSESFIETKEGAVVGDSVDTTQALSVKDNSEMVNAVDKSAETIEVKQSPAQKTKDLVFNVFYNFEAPGDTDQITFTCVLPKNYERRQVVNEINYSIDPKKTFEKNGLEYATFVIDNPASVVKLEISSDLTLYEYDYDMAKSFNEALSSNTNVYLTSEANIESDNRKIIDALELDGMSEEDKLKRIYDFVLKRLTYKDVDFDEGALFALSNREGDCQEYSDLFIALCRSEGIPARAAEGFTTIGTANGHEWVEAYIKAIGWVPFDLTYADSEYAEEKFTFNNLDNVYIYYSHLRNDPQFSYSQKGETKYGHYWQCSFDGDKISVERKIEVIK